MSLTAHGSSSSQVHIISWASMQEQGGKGWCCSDVASESLADCCFFSFFCGNNMQWRVCGFRLTLPRL